MQIPRWVPARRFVTAQVFPGASTRVDRAQIERSLVPGEELLDVGTSRGERVAVVHRPPSGSPTAPSNGARRYVLFLYGNAMTLADTPQIREVLSLSGAGVVCVDYPGYGLSPGEPSEGGCYRAAHAALDLLERQHGMASASVDVVGWSLGTAVSVQVAARRPVRRLVLLSPFAGVASYVLGPVRLDGTPLTRLGPFSGARRAGAVQAPTLLVSGEEDRVTPPAMARALARGITGPTELLMVPRTGHNDLFARPVVWQAVRTFLDA